MTSVLISFPGSFNHPSNHSSDPKDILWAHYQIGPQFSTDCRKGECRKNNFSASIISLKEKVDRNVPPKPRLACLPADRKGRGASLAIFSICSILAIFWLLP
jgi:hypothetical protein